MLIIEHGHRNCYLPIQKNDFVMIFLGDANVYPRLTAIDPSIPSATCPVEDGTTAQRMATAARQKGRGFLTSKIAGIYGSGKTLLTLIIIGIDTHPCQNNIPGKCEIH